MTKFLNISTDNTLGGSSASDVLVASQKAVKDYVDQHGGGLPDQTGHAGEFLTTDGTDASWSDAIGYHPDLFDHKWADHILNDVQWLRADTFSWQAGSVYQAAYQHLADDITGKTLQSETVGGVTIQFYLSDDGHKICPASEENNVLSIYNATGVAWYYIIDTTNQRFKLPRTQFGFTGIRSGVGNYVPESVPNITGKFGIFGQWQTMLDQYSGAFTYETLSEKTGSAGSWDNIRVGVFDASRSSSAYQDNAPVQQRATEQYLYFYVGNFTQTALENTAGLNAELFNQKADLDLSNINASASAKNTILGWGVPDFNSAVAIGVNFKNSPYTIQNDGFYTIRLNKDAYNNAAYVKVNGIDIMVVSISDSWDDICQIVLLHAGDILTATGAVYVATVDNYVPFKK